MTLKPSKNVKNKMIMGEKVITPPEIVEKITQDFEEGVNEVMEDEIRVYVDTMYTKP